MKEKEVLAIITYPVFVAAGMICPSADIFEPNSTSRVYRSNEKPPRGLPFMSSLAVGGTLASSDMFRWGEKLEMYSQRCSSSVGKPSRFELFSVQNSVPSGRGVLDLV